MSKRVLVVEDEPTIQDILYIALRRAGYEVFLAHDGYDALVQLQQMIPDLILLDLMMPHMNGFRFINELDQRGMRSVIPIVVLSAYAKIEDLKHMQVSAYLPKPFSLQRLLETVRCCVRDPLPQV